MSGIEVAGVVLAVLPLFISALEHYEDGTDPIRLFLEYDHEFPNHIRKLRDQHIMYNLTIKELLLSVAESEEVEDMISDPGGACWKDVSMQNRLEERLDESYQAYLDTIKQIEEIMKTIAKDLKIDQSDRTTRADLQSLLMKAPRKDNQFEFGRRVKFGMRRKKFKRLLDELDSENQKLERFTNKTERLESYRTTTKTTSIFNPPLHDIRLYAKNLYGVLCVGAGCSQSRHQAKLQLEKRLYPKRSKTSWKQPKEISQNTRPCFRVSLYASRWQDVEVQILESESSADEKRATQPKQTSQPQAAVPNPNPSSRPVALSAVAGNKGLPSIEESHTITEKHPGPHAMSSMFSSGKKKSGFSMSMSSSFGLSQKLDKVHNSIMNGKSVQHGNVKPAPKAVGWAMSEAPKVTLHELPIRDSKPNTLLEVIDICSAIRRCKTRKICLGLCLDHGGTLRRALSIPLPEKHDEEKPAEDVPDSKEATSLNKLLMPDPNHYGHTLSRKDRMSLALILASSFVQLDATQWIQESWGKEDIVFDPAPDAPKDNSVDISKPYILHSIEKSSADKKPQIIQRSANYSLLSLGILLLELYTGQSFEQHLSRIKGKSISGSSLDPPEESLERLIKLNEASNWLKAVQDDLSIGFQGAIAHCIHSYFKGSSGKDEANYRQEVLDQVVLPLQDDLQSFLGTRTL
ncbi:hypothetical protein V494_05049 [Pseudogymnoascus sp. VKM F-4513 (FW-928)]|nr:hypothetical protein V494_05049 [Pseudogymnoascus sp. VKM F-4513 (FW-928)]